MLPEIFSSKFRCSFSNIENAHLPLFLDQPTIRIYLFLVTSFHHSWSFIQFSGNNSKRSRMIRWTFQSKFDENVEIITSSEGMSIVHSHPLIQSIFFFRRWSTRIKRPKSWTQTKTNIIEDFLFFISFIFKKKPRECWKSTRKKWKSPMSEQRRASVARTKNNTVTLSLIPVWSETFPADQFRSA